MMKRDKINLIVTGILIILIALLFTLYNQKIISKDSSTLKEVEELKEKVNFLENSIIENGESNIQLQINGRENINCALISRESGAYNKLVLYDYTGNGGLGNVENIAIDGYDYLKTLGGGKHNIYSGIQCRADNGWTLIDGKTSEYSVKDIDGSLKVVKDEFIQKNGYFSQRGDIHITCCKIV